MKTILSKINLITLITLITLSVSAQDATQIIEKVDANMSSDNRIFESEMTIHGRRSSRTVVSKSYSEGNEKSFTEYLSPASEKGTKMLKLEKQLWIYSPSTDRTIQISGHMLRQSVMGSDLSYEDMMDDRKLTDVYLATVAGEEVIDGRKTYLLELTAKVEDVSYHTQKMWVDTERFVPLKQELYAKSGKLLKQMEMKDVIQVKGRWFPSTVVYKDMLKQGDGTEFKITKIQFDQEIPAYIFTKAVLKQ
ncbi:MAG: outer membrane lipoprotein-sorting protein [Bacteroidetes bacterium HGW-Bacteroidetes-1]|nr:MAG: outer membrane lipoprotein-sorting protein [Bacteroidetes bacterium HGW-Bacteroidetes-1]